MNREEADKTLEECDEVEGAIGFGYRSETIDTLIDNIYDDFESRTCDNCKHRDTERPTSHPNYRECNNRESIMSYIDTHYEWGCIDFERKDHD